MLTNQSYQAYIFDFLFKNAAGIADIEIQLFYIMIMDELNVRKN